MKNKPTPSCVRGFCQHLQTNPVETFLKYSQMEIPTLDQNVENCFAYFIQHELTDFQISKIFSGIRTSDLLNRPETFELENFVKKYRHKFTFKEKLIFSLQKPEKDLSEWALLTFQVFMKHLYDLFNISF